jgi:hypothetical protein
MGSEVRGGYGKSLKVVIIVDELMFYLQTEYIKMAGVLGEALDEAFSKSAVERARIEFANQTNRSWLEWAGTMLMPGLKAKVEEEERAAEEN